MYEFENIEDFQKDFKGCTVFKKSGNSKFKFEFVQHVTR